MPATIAYKVIYGKEGCWRSESEIIYVAPGQSLELQIWHNALKFALPGLPRPEAIDVEPIGVID